ncbi:hypothetical protein C2759_02605 [Polynucleobacter sp. MG-Unter2-18]|uniref:hypothetical protein n=1 Tax=Polynucleobacter sp. MG-Unter2-18 TaxID=2081052 RepID=UPI001BFE5A81|nr:hypothetical protein [Polynucleobacter sp. MG-Unter2-18]QWD95047.1 hypothetical protein C2759_02605 [Polynucleobacter sp. MG-Unter2-18]
MGKKELLKNSKPILEALLRDKNASPKAQSKSYPLGPIEAAIKNNPGLTREKAVMMAEELGF